MRRLGMVVAGAAAMICLIVMSARGLRAQASGATSGVPLQANLPHSWFRNYDYGVEVDGKLNPDAGLYQIAGQRVMLIFGPSLVKGYALFFDPKVVHPVPKADVTVKSDMEVMVPQSAIDASEPVPWMQDGPSAVIFYADSKRYRIARVPPIVGTTTLDEIFQRNPMYKRGMEEYRPHPSSIDTLKAVKDKVEIEVWFGSWCPHCQKIVPQFLKTLQLAANPNISVSYHGVPRDFGSYGPARDKGVNALPTFIFLRDGKEFTRMGGEAGVSEVEDEMARILGGGTTTTAAGGK